LDESVSHQTVPQREAKNRCRCGCIPGIGAKAPIPWLPLPPEEIPLILATASWMSWWYHESRQHLQECWRAATLNA